MRNIILEQLVVDCEKKTIFGVTQALSTSTFGRLGSGYVYWEV